MEHIAYDEQEAWEYDEAEEGTYYTEEVNDVSSHTPHDHVGHSLCTRY